MNIFYLDHDIHKCAQYHCDKHVVKMILENCQMLSTAHHILDGDKAPKDIYKSTHPNHPSNRWVRQSDANYKYLLSLTYALYDEYLFRYGKFHKSGELFDKLEQFPLNIPIGSFVEPPQCMPDHYKHNDTVTAYRQYYIGDKSNILSYKRRNKPEWIA